ncbi:(d)CMP kinase [Bhargavaea beijingensis]|uniref:Cytidylate kinase n=1 Tax=Bhargavaea beijingensis TaxID=426756 RepID=A0A1G7AMT9_9BACL|nr:(d)CMP kinase [Bhargavaea beijingensis]MCW1928205.1 (d)CMP kinase [Bhargavaea beijingensis]RSK37891.1 (d)CMP kinase [Bhargavaea beijingensis]SDE16179.1 cytidylate kinase [Bhargavaea beijingensis]
MTKEIRIAIDGPAAAGKSTIAKLVAEKLGYTYIDTGAMYRALTYKAIGAGIDLDKAADVEALLPGTEIELKAGDKGQTVWLDGQDVTDEIRTDAVTNGVSAVSAHAGVRAYMVDAQRRMAEEGGVVMDGRDIGTAVLPDAELKVFMTASVEERARRRHAENLRRGFESSIDQLAQEIALRDKKDSEREISPLTKAEDAALLDTTSLSISEAAEAIMDLVREKVD